VPYRCLWDAPEYMTTKHALLPALSHLNNQILTSFFQETLEILDVSWDDLLDELFAISVEGQPDVENIRDIYRRLYTMSIRFSSEILEEIR
jgi:hypothetical protein